MQKTSLCFCNSSLKFHFSPFFYRSEQSDNRVRVLSIHWKRWDTREAFSTNHGRRAHGRWGHWNSQHCHASLRNSTVFDTCPLQWMRQLDWQNAEWYINNRSLPDKAINLLDEAGSMVKLVRMMGWKMICQMISLDFFVVTDDIIAILNYVRIDPMYSLEHIPSLLGP